jgi:hypothetical protein
MNTMISELESVLENGLKGINDGDIELSLEVMNTLAEVQVLVDRKKYEVYRLTEKEAA